MSIIQRITNEALMAKLKAANRNHEIAVDKATEPHLERSERDRRVRQARNAQKAVIRLQDEKWRRYEEKKKELQGLGLSADEYEAEIQKIAAELGV